MSHHHDSLLARQDPRLDISDTYLFRGTSGTAFVVNINPLSGDGGFHDDESLYEIKVDTDGDAVEDITFRFTFSAYTAYGPQRWELRRLDGADARDRFAEGTLLASGITGEVTEGPQGLRIWAGRAGDPFWIEGTVVTAVKTAIAQGTAPDLTGFDPAGAVNLFADTDVQSIVLEVPDELLGGAGSRIGFWAMSVLATDAGGWRPINRCATPLLNTLFDLEDPERHIDSNATEPAEDRARYGPELVRATARAAAASESVPDPQAHAERVRDLLLPDLLRYEVGSEARFALHERNGRGLTDCAPEVMFELVLGVPVKMGLDASAATGVPRGDFPYLSPPRAGR
ncbi:DUF4331 family protein [Streptomyces palmae]|uniref:DUF4331 domain-containing protein n=1 Tax=Streptomyces palmae TaxID=1701085 RepID=A0A4Z0G7M0_9ACTN|nr:DUF4331 family protein [Streptomyces palmae]TGA90943.1 DUF4331 domain-containing protein [Streptomyces palmae]